MLEAPTTYQMLEAWIVGGMRHDWPATHGRADGMDVPSGSPFLTSAVAIASAAAVAAASASATALAGARASGVERRSMQQRQQWSHHLSTNVGADKLMQQQMVKSHCEHRPLSVGK